MTPAVMQGWDIWVDVTLHMFHCAVRRPHREPTVLQQMMITSMSMIVRRYVVSGLNWLSVAKWRTLAISRVCLGAAACECMQAIGTGRLSC